MFLSRSIVCDDGASGLVLVRRRSPGPILELAMERAEGFDLSWLKPD